MYIRWITVSTAVSAAVLLATLWSVDDSAARQETSAVRARSAEISKEKAPPALADTLHYSIGAGNVLIVALPDSLGNTAVSGYSLRRSPALSWLAGRSFMWRTLPIDAGRHNVILTAELRDGWLETVTLAIHVK